VIKLRTYIFPLIILHDFPEKITKCVEQIAGNANIMQRHWHLTKYTTTYYNLPTDFQHLFITYILTKLFILMRKINTLIFAIIFFACGILTAFAGQVIKPTHF